MDMHETSPVRLRYSVPEAAKMLGISRTTAWRRAKTGELRTVVDGGRVLVTYEEIRRYSTRGTVLKVAS
jgi:excisionase family DNA binding protein